MHAGGHLHRSVRLGSGTPKRTRSKMLAFGGEPLVLSPSMLHTRISSSVNCMAMGCTT